MLTSEKKTFLFIVILAAAIRVYIAVAIPVIGTDSYYFTVSAKLFSEGNYYEALKQPIHPMYPILMSLGSAVTGEYEVSGEVVSLVFGILTVLIVYFLTRDLFGHKAACLSSLFLAINPSHVRLSASVLSDATYIFFFTLVIWLVSKIHRKDLGFVYYPAIGLSIFFAFTTRAEGIGLLVVVLPWLFFLNWRVKKYTFVKNVLLLFFILSAFICTAGGYLLFIHKAEPVQLESDRGFTKGRWSITQQLAASYLMGVAKPTVSSIDDPGVKARTLLKGRLPSYVRLAQWKESGQYHRIAFYVMNEYIKECYYTSIIFIFLGIFRLFPQTTGPPTSIKGYASSVLAHVWGSIRLRKAASDRRTEYFLLALLIFYFIIFFKFAYSTYYFSGRYAMPLVAVSLIWAGMGLIVASEYLAAKILKLRNYPITAQMALVGLLALILVITLPKSLKVKRQKGLAQKEAGLWIKEHFPELKNPLICGNQVVAFYAGGTYKEISKETHYNALVNMGKHYKSLFLTFYKEDFWNVNTETLEKIETDNAYTFLKEWIDYDGDKERHLELYSFSLPWFIEDYINDIKCLIATGQYKLARDFIGAVLKLDPGCKAAQELLAKLKRAEDNP